MIKYILPIMALAIEALASSQVITNETTKPMLCEINYQAQYAEEEIHGIKQRVQTHKQKTSKKVLAANESFQVKRKGTIKCYNEEEKITLYGNRGIQRTNERTLSSHIVSHEKFDIGSYINENRTFVDATYGISRQCYEYQDGEYCKKGHGLDIFFNKEGRVAKLFIYESALGNGKLPFEVESFQKIKTNGETLGLWVSDKNKQLIKKKPDVKTSNVILWKNPAPFIKHITMIAKKGYLNPNRYNRSDKKPVILQDTLGAIEIEYLLDDKAYTEYQKNRPPLKQLSNASPYGYTKVAKVPRKAKTTWGKQLNPKDIVPLNKFKAFYINTKNPSKVIASETVDKVSVNYPYNKFHGIDSKDFGGYWVGDFIFEQETKRQINISQSWAKTRIIVDGTVIFEAGKNAEVPFTFSKGKHRIEVEYINNWHTTDFMVNIKPKEKIYTKGEIQKILSTKTSKDSEVLYVGVYESRKKDQSITLHLAKQAKPVILLLNSYNPVEWIIDNTNKVNIEAVIYSAYKPGVDIKGDVPKNMPVLATKERFGSYSMKKKCSCHGATFHCEGSNGMDTINRIESLTGKKPMGFSGKYGTEALVVPKILVTDEWIKSQKEAEKEIARQRKECQQEIDPSFENIFKK